MARRGTNKSNHHPDVGRAPSVVLDQYITLAVPIHSPAVFERSLPPIPRGIPSPSWAWPLEYAYGRCFDLPPQHRMQARPSHNICRTIENAVGQVLYIHQLVKPQFARDVVKEKINVGILARLVAYGRAKHVEAYDAEPFQVGFMLLEQSHRLDTLHNQEYSTIRISRRTPPP